MPRSESILKLRTEEASFEISLSNRTCTLIYSSAENLQNVSSLNVLSSTKLSTHILVHRVKPSSLAETKGFGIKGSGGKRRPGLGHGDSPQSPGPIPAILWLNPS